MKKSIFLATLLALNSPAHAGGKELPIDLKEIKCLADTIYHEGRSTSIREQRMIGEVVLNRTKSSKFPDTICKVVYHRTVGKNGKMVRQFSWTSQKRAVKEKEAYSLAYSLAVELFVSSMSDRNNGVKGPDGTPGEKGILYFKRDLKKKCPKASSGRTCHEFR